MHPIDYAAIVSRFGSLPDDAIIIDPAAAILLGISIWTLRRNNPVPPVQITPSRRGRRAGDIRTLVRGGAAAK
jgi:hypothetical protein